MTDPILGQAAMPAWKYFEARAFADAAQIARFQRKLADVGFELARRYAQSDMTAYVQLQHRSSTLALEGSTEEARFEQAAVA